MKAIAFSAKLKRSELTMHIFAVPDTKQKHTTRQKTKILL